MLRGRNREPIDCFACASLPMRSRMRPAFSAVVCVWMTIVGCLSAGAVVEADEPDVNALRLQARQMKLESAMRLREGETFDGVGRGNGPPPASALFEDGDDDGMDDDWERDHGLDPQDPNDAWLDPDGDEVLNLFEFQLDADPRSGESPMIATVAKSGGMFSDVAVALDRVAPGTCIRVAEGEYDVNYLTFAPKVVMLQGGWEASFRERDMLKYPTTLDGEDRGVVLDFSPDFGESSVVLHGLHIVGGNDLFGAVDLLCWGNAELLASVVDCTITDSRQAFDFGGVLMMLDWEQSRSDRTIANTLIAGNLADGIYSQVTDSAQSHWRVIHATVTDNSSNGGDNGYGMNAFTLGAARLTTHLFNSIVWGNDEARFDVEVFENVTIDADHMDVGTVNTLFGAEFNRGEGVVTVDPEFADPAEGDYHLTTGSDPLVLDGGTETGIPLTDLDGSERSYGDGPDMGAYEVAGLRLAAPWPCVARRVNRWEVESAAPGKRVHFVYGFRRGRFNVPGCPGVFLDIESPGTFSNALADDRGRAEVEFYVTRQARGRTILFQAIDVSCRKSDVVECVFQ